MAKNNLTIKIKRSEDPSGVKSVKLATALKRIGGEVHLERRKTMYKIEVIEQASLDSILGAVERCTENLLSR